MSHKVLIVEDTRSFATLLQGLLQETYQFDSDIAYCLKEAEALLAIHKDEYFAAIVDLTLPDAPNGEAVDLSIAAGLPTIVFTGTTNLSMKEDLWHRGISDYAHKSGAHSIENVLWSINRIFLNASTEILVVDDSIVARKSILKILKTQRLITHSAADGLTALGILDANPNITVAILDCHMEGMDGFELASQMRRKRSRESLEIIGISSAGTGEVSAQFIKSGANDFLNKPFIPEEILCRVNRAAERVEVFKKLEELNHTKNRFLGTAAHDLRGPIGAIKTAATYILNRTPSESRRQKLVEMIEKCSTDLIDLLAELLDVSAIESGEIQLNISRCNITDLLNDRIDLYSSEAESKNIAVELTIIHAVATNIDLIKMRQVVDNVLTNALKYSPIGSQVYITLDSNEKNILIKISDSGGGVPVEEQIDLFNAYKTLSPQSTGGEKSTGLGLAIADNIIRAHNGSITYSDSASGGACFTIKIPKN